MDDSPIAWTALQRGTPIRTSDGAEIGKVKEVVADEDKDIFSGVTFSPGLTDKDRFIPAELIDTITDDAVTIAIPSAKAGSLESYEA